MSTISPQGYLYGEDPKSSNPFWADDETEEVINQVTFSATTDQTTGEASVDVTKDGYNVNFAFSGIKGETGATGAQGETGATGATGAQGEKGADGISPTVVSTGATGSSESAGTITGADGTVITVYNGAQGEKGETGATGPAGSTEGLVSNVAVTNENGVYTISQTKDGTTTEVGTIEVPDVDTTNVLAEVTDSVVENATAGYDFHTIKETEYNGTSNDVGSFYLARKQITALNSDGSFTTVDQSGTEGTGQLNISSAWGGLEMQPYTLLADATGNVNPPCVQLQFTIADKTTSSSITVSTRANNRILFLPATDSSPYSQSIFQVSPSGSSSITVSNLSSNKYILVKLKPYYAPAEDIYTNQAAVTSYGNYILSYPLQMLLGGYALIQVSGEDTDAGLVVTCNLSQLIVPKFSTTIMYLSKQSSSAGEIISGVA